MSSPILSILTWFLPAFSILCLVLLLLGNLYLQYLIPTINHKLENYTLNIKIVCVENEADLFMFSALCC